jgi:HprK-related kinase A
MSAPTAWRHYQVGVVGLSVASDYAEAADDFARLYAPFACATPPPEAIRVTARRTRAGWRGTRYAIYGDDRLIFDARRPGEVFPYLEWAINWRIVARRGEFLQLHAATVACNDQVFVLAGDSGAGKSTLAAGLIARGWTYFAEEFALLDPDRLHVHPFPKALCLKHGSFAAARACGLPLWRRAHFAKDFKGPVAYVAPWQCRGPLATAPRPVHTIVFPRYCAGGATRLTPLSRAAAALRLTRGTFNPPAFGARLVPLLARLVRGAACYELEGAALDDSCAALEELADELHRQRAATRPAAPVADAAPRPAAQFA